MIAEHDEFPNPSQAILSRKMKRITMLQHKPVNSGLTSHSTKSSPVFSGLVQKMTKRFHRVKWLVLQCDEDAKQTTTMKINQAGSDNFKDEISIF